MTIFLIRAINFCAQSQKANNIFFANRTIVSKITNRSNAIITTQIQMMITLSMKVKKNQWTKCIGFVSIQMEDNRLTIKQLETKMIKISVQTTLLWLKFNV